MSSVSGPRFNEVFYGGNNYGASFFTEKNEFNQLQEYANKIGKIVAKERSFTLAFSIRGEVSCGGFGCLPYKQIAHASLLLSNLNRDPGDSVFKESPDISHVKIPNCMLPLFQRLEPKRNPALDSAPLYIKFDNSAPNAQAHAQNENKVVKGVICRCFPVSLQVNDA
ncbi:MAG TPA: hypothetical protein VLE89_07370 [Chlamydiales bacterium]|nr:hypothetical protein [Chlamydiales bacterium]